MSDVIYDLCIVGAGMFGSAAARHASAIAGDKVCLVGPEEPTPEERMTRKIFASYYDEGRVTRIVDDDVPNLILSKHSISRYRELEELSGIPIYHPVGLLWVNKKNSPSLKKILQVSNTLNLPVLDLSYHDIFQRRFPYIKVRDDDHPILEDFGAGHISPRKMVAAQKKVASDQGCVIIQKVVDEVKPLKNGIHEIITEDGGILKAKRVLICGGAFTNLKKFPIPKLKININKETVVLFKLPVEEVQRLSAMPTIIYDRQDELGAYIFPPIKYPDGNHYLKIGHLGADERDRAKTLEEVRNWYLSKGDPAKIERLTKIMIDMLPGLRYEEITGMTCVTCDNPTGHPYINRISPTVTVAVVGNRTGGKFSDEVGRIAAMLSLTGRWESDICKSHFRVVLENDTIL